MQYWPAIVFGWPSAVVGGVLLLAAVVRRNVGLGIAGAVIAAGFCVYVSLNPPPFRWLGVLAFGGNVLSVAAVRQRATVVAAVGLIPFLAALLFMVRAVLSD